MRKKANGDSKGKVVVDVGTGTGVLSIWSAKAGARKVYAIDVTETAKHALKCTAAGGVGDVVKVLQQRVEYVDLSHYRKGPTTPQCQSGCATSPYENSC